MKHIMKFPLHVGDSLGESLVEVLVAVGILMTILVPAAELYLRGDTAMLKSKRILVARQLATSGVDMMRSLYETNLRRFEGKESECWTTKPDSIDFNTCQNQNSLLTTGSYVLNSVPGNMTLRRIAAPQTLSLNLSQESGEHGDGEYRLKLSPDGLYLHDAGEAGEETPYYREINLLLTDNDNADGNGNENTGVDMLEIESIVRFKVGLKTQQAAQTFIISKPTE